MNVFLWVLQAILAVKLLTVAIDHGFRQGKPEMKAAMQKIGKPAQVLLYLTTLGSFFGALALILPGLLNFNPILTPLVAMAVAVMLMASLLLHLRSREKPKIFVSLVLAAFAIFIAIGRW